MTLKNKALRYFEAFSNQNLQHLANMLYPHVVLRDWEREVESIDEVIAANKQIFDSVDSINVRPLALYEDNNVVIAELEITVDGTEKLLVVDIITFDVDSSDPKIISIKAYKG